MAQHHRLHTDQMRHAYRFSRDSGHGTDPESSRSHSVSPTKEQDGTDYMFPHPNEEFSEVELAEKRGLLGNAVVDRVLSRLPVFLPKRLIRIFDTIHKVLNRVILLFGFMAITSGAVVYGGVFVSGDPLDPAAPSAD